MRDKLDFNTNVTTRKKDPLSLECYTFTESLVGSNEEAVSFSQICSISLFYNHRKYFEK